jgi:hypothetical protein
MSFAVSVDSRVPRTPGTLADETKTLIRPDFESSHITHECIER